MRTRPGRPYQGFLGWKSIGPSPPVPRVVRARLNAGHLFDLVIQECKGRMFRFNWKWRRRSPSKVMERTHEEATEALHVGREGHHPEAASAGEGADLEALR